MHCARLHWARVPAQTAYGSPIRQGDGGDRRRKFRHGAPLRRRERRARVARRNVSRHRLGEERRLFFSRVIRHGKRRAEEMREAAATVREAGLEALCASAIAERQAWVAISRVVAYLTMGVRPRLANARRRHPAGRRATMSALMICGDADTRVANAASVPHGRQCPHAPVEPVPSEIHGRRRSYSFLTTR